MSTPGLTLEELAARQGRSEADVRQSLRPFIAAGIVVERAGRLYVADRQVLGAYAGQPEEGAAA